MVLALSVCREGVHGTYVSPYISTTAVGSMSDLFTEKHGYIQFKQLAHIVIWNGVRDNHPYDTLSNLQDKQKKKLRSH